MTLADETQPNEATIARTLSARRPGHAVMLRVLAEVGPAAQTQVAPQMPVASRSWYDGAIGELIVGHELASLPSDWRVLHAVPAGSKGRDIDHLVIGPGGVFVLNTKRHLEADVRAGTHVTWIRNTQHRYQADIGMVADEVQTALAGVLPPDVHPAPVLVFVQSRSLSHVGEQRVAAIRSHDLVSYLRCRRPVLSADQVASVVALAEQPDTWGAPADVLDEPDPTVRFLGLRPPIGQPAPPRQPVVLAPSAPAQRPQRQAPALRTAARRTRRGSRRELALLLRLLSGLLMIPITIGIFQVVARIWLGLLTGH